MNPYSGSGTLFRFDVDLTQLHGKNFTLAGLPDGRPLPDVNGGVLPRWTFSVQNVPINLYLANGAFALFVPVPLTADGYSLSTVLSQEFDDEHGNLVGKLYAIPTQDAGTISGVLVLVPYVDQNGSHEESLLNVRPSRRTPISPPTPTATYAS